MIFRYDGREIGLDEAYDICAPFWQHDLYDRCVRYAIRTPWKECCDINPFGDRFYYRSPTECVHRGAGE